MFRDDEAFLFSDWIYPNKLEDFKDKIVLECGCGGGHHTSFMAPFAKKIVAVDLNTVDLAKERTRKYNNIDFIETDIATMDLKTKFDIVMAVGVVHHTDDPDRTVKNLMSHVKPEGKLILWVYSQEGNFLVRNMVEPFRKLFLRKMGRESLAHFSALLTSLMYLPVYTIYALPVSFLPYYEYFQNWKKLSFNRNKLNVFDKLNAPQVHFINRERISNWFRNNEYEDIHVSPYKNVSWRVSGRKKCQKSC